MVSDDEERAIDAIVQTGRDARPKTSRTMWIAALVIGAIAIAAFVVTLLADGAPSGPLPQAAGSGRGFSTGLAIGVAVGIAIGLAIARKKRD